ncbi:NfeD family protein [Chitinibacteraceae bacterium HSL-7]
MSATTLWLVAALILAGLEMFTATFYLLAIAAGLLLGALASALGQPLAVQWIAAAIGSAVAWYAVWRYKRKLPRQRNVPIDVGQRVTVERWSEDGYPTVRHRGASWQAQPARPDLPTDRPAYFVVDVRGNTLVIDDTPPSSHSE